MPPKLQYFGLLLSIIPFCHPAVVSAQQRPPSDWAFLNDPVYAVTTLDGLPSDALTALVFDRQGFAWVGTNNGLARWDGLKAVAYQHGPEDTASISGNYIRPNALKYDPEENRLLIGAEGGLSILNLETNQFTNHYINEQDKNCLQGMVLSVFLDSENEIWLGTSKGLAKKTDRDGHFQHFPLPISLADTLDLSLERLNAIFDIVQDPGNPQILWLATLEGLVKFNSAEGSFRLFRATGKQYVKRMNEMNELALHSNGNLYIGTWNYDLSVFNTATEQFITHLGPGAANAAQRYEEALIPFFEKSEKELWVGSIAGLGILNTEVNEVEFIKTFRNPAGVRYYPHFLAIHQNDHWWVGSDYGLQYFSERKPLIQNYFFPPRDESHMYLTNSFFESQAKDRLYIGYNGGEGLHYFDLATKRFHVLPYPTRAVREKTILKILPGQEEGTLYFLTRDELYLLKEQRNRITRLNLPDNPLIENTDMLPQGKEYLWISGNYNGVRRYHLPSGRFTDFINWKDYFQKRDNDRPNVLMIEKDGAGRVYFSRYGKSYGYFVPGTSELHYFDRAGRQFRISSFYFSNDTLWAGVEGAGLGFFDPHNPQKGLALKYNAENGLISNFIQDIERDRHGRFWLLTGAGLECIAPHMKTSIHVDEYYGLKQMDLLANRIAYLPGKLFQLADGRLIVGYRRGIGMFHPDSLALETAPITPYLSRVKVFDQELPLDSATRANKSIKLAHHQNYITFDYSALSLYRGKYARLLHKLEGIDLHWVESKEHSASYSKVPPGEYRFIVKLDQSSGHRGSSELIYTIRISPPWWNNPYAWSAYIILAFGAGWSWYRFQVRRKLIIKDAEKAKELEQFKSRLYANITHEFRTPLTIILGMADQIKEDPGKWFGQGLNMIKRNGRKLLNLTNQMLELSKLEASSVPVNMMRGDVVVYLKYLVESFHSLAGMKNISLAFSAVPEKIMMDFDPDKIQDILANLLSNAIKFTPEGGSIRVSVSEKQVPGQEYLVFSVTDTGEGISAEDQEKVFDRYFQAERPQGRSREGTGLGLALASELAKLLKGEIFVQSVPGCGSTFTVQLPLHNEKAPGHPEAALPGPIAGQREELAPNDESEETEQLTLLIVDDNQDVLQYLQSLLSDRYQTIMAKNGLEGFQKAAHHIPDLIISDVMMPVMDGFAFCQQLKTDLRTSHIPVVLLTARADAESKVAGLEAGADAYLAKPFNQKELFTRISKLIELRQALRSRYSEGALLNERDAAGKGGRFEKEDAFLREVRQLLESHLDDEEFGIAELCRSLGMSRSQLYRKFKAITSITVGSFIQKLRLAKAKKLLLTTDLNVSEVALETGFKNLSHFSRVFSETFGVAPSKARQQ
ncbi:MAG: response regulator [Phaeodactylibacter sp.]|nr:response regulator [Phaeodactylibacter sp.]